MNRKAMFFTLLTIAILGIFIFAFSYQEYQRLSNRALTVEARVTSLNDFLSDVRRDIGRGLYISGFRSVLALSEYMINQGTYVDDVQSRFREAMINGTINGSTYTVLQGSTFKDWAQRIQFEGDKVRIDVNITLNTLDVVQDDPWNVLVRANVTMIVKDSAQTATFTTTEFVTAKVGIVGFEDPLYIVNGQGRLTNVINTSIFYGNFTQKINGTWYVSNLLNHTASGYYVADEDAPSFLMRFENDLESSPYGIESLVDLAKFEAQGIQTYENSIVDHKYFANSSGTLYRINFTPSWFVIDQAHLAQYNVTGVSYGVS
ncbi:hypothetical protein J4464_01560 [Candidatus Woesearchaeota archaeon]|nr:hypothetical protein [Candidatus Woesearchaeota archaeon]